MGERQPRSLKMDLFVGAGGVLTALVIGGMGVYAEQERIRPNNDEEKITFCTIDKIENTNVCSEPVSEECEMWMNSEANKDDYLNPNYLPLGCSKNKIYLAVVQSRKQ